MCRLLITALLVLVVYLAPKSTTALALADGPSQQDRAIEFVNQERLARGLEPVKRSPELSASAQRYADTMATLSLVSHVGLDGSTYILRDEAAGYVDWYYIAENIAGGQPDAQAAVSAWMASPIHRMTLLSPHARELGVGHVYRPGSKYRYYWVLELGAR